ncbi:MAG: hypothetical protein IBGAMO2_970002 [Arenicellales bacterium IbO2]|nr:MAG: hypothetical protein IBGAMO2_970002 [Arenicellales bacterium IbO2]
MTCPFASGSQLVSPVFFHCTLNSVTGEPLLAAPPAQAQLTAMLREAAVERAEVGFAGFTGAPAARVTVTV